MFRSHILTAVALLAMCVVPGFAYGMTDQPVAPSSASSYQDLRSPDARDAQSEPVTQVAQDLRSADAKSAAGNYVESSPAQVAQDLRSPDARDAKTEPVAQAAQDLRSPDAKSAAGNYVESSPVQLAQDLRSPDARDAATQSAKVELAQDLRSPDARDAGLPEAPTSDTIVEIREAPVGGFDWGDAGIGAAGLLAMLSIAGGLALLSTRRRRRGTEMPAH